MSRVDSTGVSPGLDSSGLAQEKVINIKCRNSRGCDSIEASEVNLGGASHHGQHMYRCLKCGHTWGVSLGGHIDI
jgi:hypothetical protein